MGCTASIPKDMFTVSRPVPISESVTSDGAQGPVQQPGGANMDIASTAAASVNSETPAAQNKENTSASVDKPAAQPSAGIAEKRPVTEVPKSPDSKAEVPADPLLAEARKKLPPLEISNTLEARPKLPELKPLASNALSPAGGLGLPALGAKPKLPPVGFGGNAGPGQLAPLSSAPPPLDPSPSKSKYVDLPPPQKKDKAPKPASPPEKKEKKSKAKPSPPKAPAEGRASIMAPNHLMEPMAPRLKAETSFEVHSNAAQVSSNSSLANLPDVLGNIPSPPKGVAADSEEVDSMRESMKRRVSFAADEELESIRTITPVASPAAPAAHPDPHSRPFQSVAPPIPRDMGSYGTGPSSATSAYWDPPTPTKDDICNTSFSQLPDMGPPASEEDADAQHAGVQLAGRWQFSGFDGGVLEITQQGNGNIKGSLQGKRSGSATGKARLGHVFKGHTRKEDMSIRLVLSPEKNAFRGYYYAKAQPGLGCLWDATTTESTSHPFAANWDVKDLGEEVNVALNLKPEKEAEPEALEGQFVIPGEDGGVRVTGVASHQVPVASMKLDCGSEVILASDGGTLLVWVASNAGAAMGDTHIASRAADLDFIP